MPAPLFFMVGDPRLERGAFGSGDGSRGEEQVIETTQVSDFFWVSV